MRHMAENPYTAEALRNAAWREKAANRKGFSPKRGGAEARGNRDGAGETSAQSTEGKEKRECM